jgi:hypothetical protein
MGEDAAAGERERRGGKAAADVGRRAAGAAGVGGNGLLGGKARGGQPERAGLAVERCGMSRTWGDQRR